MPRPLSHQPKALVARETLWERTVKDLLATSAALTNTSFATALRKAKEAVVRHQPSQYKAITRGGFGTLTLENVDRASTHHISTYQKPRRAHHTCLDLWMTSLGMPASKMDPQVYQPRDRN